VSWHRLVIKDAARQLIWRIISALFWFLTIKIITPYLWPLQYWDYSTILKYFAIWTALADLGLYVLAVKRLWSIKESWKDPNNEQLKSEYWKFVWTRIIIMTVIYLIAILVAYFLPAYTSNPYIIRWLPFGLIFSASFMLAGIQQLPLQIFWRMDQLSITLITARLAQIAILVPVVYIFFKNMKFDWSTISIIAFCGVLFSVVASWIWQNIEIHLRSKKILPLKIKFDWKFTKNIVTKNRQYWVSYYLSSFHTLIVLLFLWWFFPTSWWSHYVWMRALALSLIEILLIIPSSLWNSLLHKISNYSIEAKRKSMWNLMTLVYRMWWIVAINFRLFADQIILIVSWKAFIWTFGLIQYRWSNQILPFLGVVLRRSFIKQIYNYLFVSVERQNVLLWINLFWVIIWVLVGIYTIPKYWLLWWIITQVLLEFLFMIWAIAVAKVKKINLVTPWKTFWKLSVIIIAFWWIWFLITQYIQITILNFFLIAAVLNLALIYISLPSIKKLARWLTFE